MRLGMAMLTCAAVCAVGAAAMTLDASPVVIFNGSPSAPRGFYVRVADAPSHGAFVTVRAAAVAPDYARTRGFADPTDRFIKRVAAGPGSMACARGSIVLLDGHGAIARAARDTAGRTLPRWNGCRTLASDEVFLLGDTPDSFDARYWGPTRISDIDGVWRPLGAQRQRTENGTAISRSP